MNNWLIIIVITGLMYIIETRPLYSILKYIVIIISLSMYILDYGLNYMSYILIIIYLSALAILFAFVIMFFTNLTTFNKSNTYYSKSGAKSHHLPVVLFYSLFLIVILSTIFYLIYTTKTNYNFMENEKMIVTDLIKKIGVILYNNNMVIWNLFGVTFILFVALVGILLLFS
jgi:NADH-quinone oxidoreductase subunit J